MNLPPASIASHDKSLILFEYKDAPFRVVPNGLEMFIAKDVCAIWGYKNPWKAVVDHCKYPEKLSSTESVLLTGQPNPIIMIPESELYRLIMRSNLPDVEQFQDWNWAMFTLATVYYGIGGISEHVKTKSSGTV